jgi:chromate transporter
LARQLSRLRRAATPERPSQEHQRQGTALEVLAASTRLGLSSFGGPVAHFGYFRDEYVVRRRWVDEQTYAELIALCQFLPGPASSQLGIALGITRAGLLGGLAAWLGFTLPSAIVLTLFAYSVQAIAIDDTGWLHGLKVVAVAVVAQAVYGMARMLCRDLARAAITVTAALAAIGWPGATTQVLVIALAGVVGWRLLRASGQPPAAPLQSPADRRLAAFVWGVFLGLLLGLPLLRQTTSSHAVALFDSFFRVGSLVFGGGHVVLPLLRSEVVPPGWITDAQFVAGYGAAQAVPGPLFTFAAYLGAAMRPEPNGWAGACLALVAIFLPSFLLVIGCLPFWEVVRRQAPFQAALGGINAAVVGLLLAALYNPIWTSAIDSVGDLGLALAALGLLTVLRVPQWLVVIFSAIGGALLPDVRLWTHLPSVYSPS